MLNKIISHWKIGILILIAVVCFYAAKYMFKFNDDSFIEEKLESYIEDQTSLDIDLTPSSPENS